MDRMNIGIGTDRDVDFEIIGQRFKGSFRRALLKYGFNKTQIDCVIDDLDCDRERVIEERGTNFHLRPM
jgi:hypothetical protein